MKILVDKMPGKYECMFLKHTYRFGSNLFQCKLDPSARCEECPFLQEHLKPIEVQNLDDQEQSDIKNSEKIPLVCAYDPNTECNLSCERAYYCEGRHQMLFPWILSNVMYTLNTQAKFLFGDIVVVDECNIGVIVKTWEREDSSYYYEVYVRMYNEIRQYNEKDIQRYRVRHKYLDEQELDWQKG